MTRRRLIWLIVSVIIFTALGGGYAGWRFYQNSELIAAAVPRRPDLSRAHSVLVERVTQAEKHAKFGPDRSEALKELARLYQANGFNSEASVCYQCLVQIDGSNPLWAHRLATILAAAGQLDDALPLWRSVVKKAPDHLPARIRLGDVLLKMNEFDEAAKVYGDVLNIDASNPYAEFGLARIDVARENWNAAKDRLEKASSQSNTFIGSNLLATVYEHLGMDEAALKIRSVGNEAKAFFDVPDPWIDEIYEDCYDSYRLCGVAAYASRYGDGETAFKLTWRAVQVNPEDPFAHFQLGLIMQQRNELKEAQQHFARCSELKPDFADAWARLYVIQDSLGQKAAAAITLETGLKNCPNSPFLHLSNGRRLAELGSNEEAMNEFKAFSRLRPEEGKGFHELAVLLLKQNRIEEGIQALLDSHRSQPENPAAISALAFCYIQLGREKEAREWIEHIKRQVRIAAPERDGIIQAFQQRFGHNP